MYLAGPGDVCGTFRHWLAERDDTRQLALTYSGQFFDACRELKAEALVIANNPRADALAAEGISVRHEPLPQSGRHGLAFQRAQAAHGLAVIREARAWNADVVFCSYPLHTPLYALAAAIGVRMAPCLHSAIWQTGFTPKRPLYRLKLAALAQAWRASCIGAIGVSDECVRQMASLLGGARFPLYSVRAQYRPADFQDLPPAPRGPVFRLLFSGRLEREKGALDLIRIAELLHKAEPGRFAIDIAGDGGAANEVRSAIEKAGLSPTVRMLGQLDRHGLLEALGRCDAVLVPTTSAWVEGLNKVVIEGILAGRPVVTSKLTNAGDDVAPALLLARPDDPADYAAAITRLASQPELYNARRDACHAVRPMFFDRRFSFGAAVVSIARSRLGPAALGVPSPCATVSATRPPPPTAVDHRAAAKRRIAVVQHGDLTAARELLASGQNETYFGMKYSVQCIDHLVGDCEHLVISLDAPVSDIRAGRGRLIGMPIPPRRPGIPNIVTYLAWARRVGRIVAEFDPTHVLVRTGMSPVVCEVLRHTTRRRVSSLVIKANLVEQPRKITSAGWLYHRRMVRLLNDPTVFLVGNHKFPASASVIAAGVHAEKVVAWDWPGIRHPKDHPVKPPPPPGRCKIVYVGVMSVVKGAADVIDAAAELKRRGLSVSLTMMGNGPDLPRLRQQAAELLGPAAMLMGPVANAAAFAAMLDSDLVVVPSRKEFAEGMPLTLTEALASRTPVIASDHPVIASAFQDGEGLRIFRAADPQSLADAAQSAVGDPVAYGELSRSTLDAFARVECHTLFGELLDHWQARTSGEPDRTP